MRIRIEEIKITLLAFLFFVTQAVAKQDNADFTYEGQPINPACIALFNDSLADSPYISAVNLDDCQYSNAAYQKTTLTSKGWVFYYNNNRDSRGGYYQYRLVGKSSNNIYVLNTENNGGGTGIFSELLLVRITSKQMAIYDRSPAPEIKTYSQLELLGYVRGGDRCSGVFPHVDIKFDLLFVTQYDNERAYECDKMREFIIDLSELTT